MNRSGFTLIELMVAVSIIGVVLLAVTQMLVQSLVGAAKAEAITRIKNNGDTALVAMERAIREGQRLELTPNPNQYNCSTSTKPRLRFLNQNGDRVIIEAINDSGTDRVQITEAGNARFVTEKDVVVTGLSFDCSVPTTGRRDKVRIEFTLSYNGGARASRAVDTNFYTSVMMRNKVDN